MKLNKIKYLSILTITLSLLSSCYYSEADRWSYSREDMSNFLNLSAKLDVNDDNSASFNLDSNITLFNQVLTKDDIIVFDIAKAQEKMNEDNKDYADYDVLSAASLNVTSINTLAELDGFDVNFETQSTSTYGMLIHHSVSASDQYIMVSKYTESTPHFDNDPQSEFEEKYATSGMSWVDGGQFVYQMIANIGGLIVGVATENPAAIANGIFAILGSLTESFCAKGTTIQDVMDQLKETDRKIDELSEKIDRNTQQLADEIVRAEAMVDQTNLNTLNLAINDFATNSLSKINTFNRNLTDEVGFYYRDYVKTNQTINLILTQNEDGEWESTPLGNMPDTPLYTFSLTINEFTNAVKFLKEHNNIVTTGFMDAFEEDIDIAIANKTDLPNKIEYDVLRGFITSMIYEEFAKEYFSNNKDKAQEYRNLMIDYVERIAGLNLKTSVLQTYFNRLKCMYNFASEIKAPLRTMCANILLVMDMNTARASQACLFAEMDDSELQTKFKSTRETVQNFYKSLKETPDTYSFTSSVALTGGFYEAKYDVYYTNPGNHCNLNVNFKFYKEVLNGYYINDIEDDLSKHLSLSATQHSRIVTRWNLLRATGSADLESDYIHYLENVGIISKECMDAADFLMYCHIALRSCYRILTSDRTERDLTLSDTSKWMYCVGQGNPDGDYFTVGNGYGYREKHDEYSWYGRVFEAAFVDASSGGYLGQQDIATWARYAESHWYWIDDEYWAFKTFENTNFFFSVYAVSEE